MASAKLNDQQQVQYLCNMKRRKKKMIEEKKINDGRKTDLRLQYISTLISS